MPVCFSGEELCTDLRCTDTRMRTLAIVIGALFLAVLLFLLFRIRSELVVMLFILFSLGIAYYVICPLGTAPDEMQHFYRAYEISQGDMLSKHLGKEGTGGNFLPASLVEYKDPEAVLNPEETKEYHFGTMSLYAPVCYLPQAFGIWLARLFTDKVQLIFYAGRLFGLICCLVLAALALRWVPFGRRLFFAILIFPMSLQEMIAISPDGLTICLSLAFLARILKICYENKPIGKKELGILTALACVLTFCKIVYVVEVLALMLLPDERMGGKKKARIIKVGIIALVCALSAVWLMVASGYLVEFQRGVSTKDQLWYIIRRPHSFYKTIVRTLFERLQKWTGLMIGSTLGALNIKITGFVWLVYLVVFLGEFFGSRDSVPDVTGRMRVVMNTIVFIGFLLVCTSLYVQWTPYKRSTIKGIQGRYFTPLLAFFVIGAMVYKMHDEVKEVPAILEKEKTPYLYVILAELNAIALLDVIAFCYGLR